MRSGRQLGWKILIPRRFNLALNVIHGLTASSKRPDEVHSIVPSLLIDSDIFGCLLDA